MARWRWAPRLLAPGSRRWTCTCPTSFPDVCRFRPSRATPLAAGFSSGRWLGGEQGGANAILFNAKARKEFEAFFARSDTFALGICNGCQMMSALKELIPGARHWPTVER